MAKLIGYARTSSTEQIAGLEAQIRDLEAAGVTKLFKEQTSSVGDREKLDKALAYLRGGDTLVVTKVDRLARSTVGLWGIVNRLEAVEDGGAALRILNLGGEIVDTKSATGRLILTIFSGFAQFEREIMLERQREGIAKAKAEGKFMGRKPTARAKSTDVSRLAREGIGASEISRRLGISRASTYRILSQS